MCLLMLFCNSKIHFHQLGPFKLMKKMLKSLNVLYGLSPVWIHYPKGIHNAWGTLRLIIAYDDFKDSIRKE